MLQCIARVRVVYLVCGAGDVVFKTVQGDSFELLLEMEGFHKVLQPGLLTLRFSSVGPGLDSSRMVLDGKAMVAHRATRIGTFKPLDNRAIPVDFRVYLVDKRYGHTDGLLRPH